jgi:hypothetical protein
MRRLNYWLYGRLHRPAGRMRIYCPHHLRVQTIVRYYVSLSLWIYYIRKNSGSDNCRGTDSTPYSNLLSYKGTSCTSPQMSWWLTKDPFEVCLPAQVLLVYNQLSHRQNRRPNMLWQCYSIQTRSCRTARAWEAYGPLSARGPKSLRNKLF